MCSLSYLNEKKLLEHKKSDSNKLPLRLDIQDQELWTKNLTVLFGVKWYALNLLFFPRVSSMWVCSFSIGNLKGSSEMYGGARIVTFMIYLTDVGLGGHTVFPQAGVGVKPEAGAALYWFNHDAVDENDSRSEQMLSNWNLLGWGTCLIMKSFKFYFFQNLPSREGGYWGTVGL